ncbi:MAG: B12-binding domain-containing protein [Actinomycetota bacterium]
MANTVDLQTAAAELGVHYQTAYRWVRNGKLPARVVEGRYVVDAADLADFSADRSAPKAPEPPSDRRVERQATVVHDALMEGDEAKVKATCGRLTEDGLSAIDLIHRVISPSLIEIGRAWHDGEIDIWVEHRASAIVERTLADVVPNPRGRRRGTAAVAAVEGDRHGLPTTMATVALRGANWNVHHLGADTPSATIHSFLRATPVDLFVLSNTNPAVADRTAEAAEAIRSTGVAVLVGQPGATLDDLVEQAAATAA